MNHKGYGVHKHGASRGCRPNQEQAIGARPWHAHGEVLPKAEELRSQGANGHLRFGRGRSRRSDRGRRSIKASTPNAVRNLPIRVSTSVMITGDHGSQHRQWQINSGSDKFEAEVLPEGKVDVVRRLQGQGRVVAMAGDGIMTPRACPSEHWHRMGTGTTCHGKRRRHAGKG